MKRLNIPLIADTLFTGVCAFLLFFTAVRFYTKSAVIGLIFGIAALFLFGALSFVYISRKQSKKLLLSRDEKNRKLLALHLSLSSDEYIKKLFCSLLGEGARISGQKVIFNDTAAYFDFKMQPLSEDDVARVIKHKYAGKKRLYCVRISPEAAVLAGNFLIEITCIDDIYSALKEKNLLPEKYVYEGSEKIKLSKRIKKRFNRKLAVPLFWSGAGLLLLSYFTFFPLYYIISGSLMLILSAASMVIGQKK